jgi:C1A family cysteine protease
MLEKQSLEMLKLKKNSKYKVQADQYDGRDLIYKSTGQPLRDIVDLRNWASPIEDQRRLGSCVSNAIVGAYELLLNRDVPKEFVDLSRLFVYYNARLIEGSPNEDTGLYLRDGIKAVKDQGICKESLWPYNVSKFSIKPSDASYIDAHHRNIKNYHRITNVEDILDALNNNRPVVLAMDVYDNFDYLNPVDFIISMPKGSESAVGGHAVCLVGYDLSQQLILARNSFGKDWGSDGYFWIPFDYLKENTLDLWVFDIVLNS